MEITVTLHDEKIGDENAKNISISFGTKHVFQRHPDRWKF
jgi:hypothetical protein